MKRKQKYGSCACINCTYGKPLMEGRVVLCKKKGLVKPDAICGKYMYDPLKRRISPLLPIPKITLPMDD
ncbi:MAG: hypothetical protein LUD44_07330 [Firmicutes bacterium]|nr:hypothetical protein [Bacillota bacterium]